MALTEPASRTANSLLASSSDSLMAMCCVVKSFESSFDIVVVGDKAYDLPVLYL